MQDAASDSNQVALVLVVDGCEFNPEAAFLGATLAGLGVRVSLVPTDFCTTGEAFQTTLQQERPRAVLLLDAMEWREINATLAALAFAAGVPRVVVTGDSLVRGGTDGLGLPSGCAVVADGGRAALARALGLPKPDPGGPDPVGLDYGVFGGAPFLDRGTACSLFAEPGTVALLASRGARAGMSPVAALARLEAVAGDAPVLLGPALACAPLDGVLPSLRAIEWWDRNFPAAAQRSLELAARSMVRQTVRLAPAAAVRERLEALRGLGVSRIVFDCDALDEAGRLPGASASAGDLREPLDHVHTAGLQSGVLLVVGLPDETPEITSARCAQLRAAAPDRLRVIPFEPASGSAAYDACERRGLWPPASERWVRDVHQPLLVPGGDAFSLMHQEALFLLSECGARGGER